MVLSNDFQQIVKTWVSSLNGCSFRRCKQAEVQLHLSCPECPRIAMTVMQTVTIHIGAFPFSNSSAGRNQANKESAIWNMLMCFFLNTSMLVSFDTVKSGNLKFCG